MTRVPVPSGLQCALLHPHVEVETRKARAALSDQVPLHTAVRQWGNAAAVVAALHQGDFDLLAEALVDVVAEPVRAAFVPGFETVRDAALDAGALACGLSGSGPTIFALTRDEALPLAETMQKALQQAEGIEGDVYSSAVDAPGAHLLDTSDAEPA